MKIASPEVCSLCSSPPSALRSQTPAPTRPAPIKIGGVTFSGSIRSRVYFWDWFQPTAGNNNYQYSGNLFRIGLSQNRDSWDWNAEFAVPFLLGLPGQCHRHRPATRERSAWAPTTSRRIPAARTPR